MEKYILKTREDGSIITVRDVQLTGLKILKRFDALCKKYDIDYSLAYGTVLGAVRHKGFIPWDDDIDVLMNYENYDKLLEALRQEDLGEYYYHCFETDPLYNVLIPAMKFRLGGTYVKEVNSLLMNKCEGDGLFIDIFIVDACSSHKLVHNIYTFGSKCMMVPLIALDNLGMNPVWLKRKFVNYARRYSKKHKNSGYQAIAITWTFDSFKDRRLLDSDYFPFHRITFEDSEFPCPANLGNFLTSLYGPNYMEPPAKIFQKPKHIDDIEL